MDLKGASNVSRRPTILHPGLPMPAFVAMLLGSTCLLVFAVVVYITVVYLRSRHGHSSSESSSTEPCSPVFPLDSSISQSTPDFLDSRGQNAADSKSIAGCRSKTVVKQHTFPVMMQRHLSFHRQLSHTINFDVPDLDLKAISVTSQPDPSSGSSSQLSADVSPCADHSTGNGNHSTRDGSDWCGTAAPSTAGRLYLTLRYDLKLSLLIVRLIRAENLPPKDFSGTSDPYVRLSLFPERKARHQTKLHRKTLNPVFEETFSFPVSVGSLRDRVLQLSVYDFDRFSRHDLIGVAVVRNLFENIEPTEEHLYQLDIVNIADTVDMGEVLLSLIYLPMAGRLTVNIMKAKNLRPVALSGTSQTYVKVTLMCHGKNIKKKKTSPKLATPNPVYNEAMVFDVPYDNIEDVHLILRVITQDEYDNCEMVGSCAVGQQILGVGHDHWVEMLENPRKPVAQWHRLLERAPSIASVTLH